MPVARGPQKSSEARTQTALSAIASGGGGRGGGGGGGGAISALVQQAQQQQQQFAKLLQTVQKLQQENAQAVQAAGQSAAGAATKVANEVARQFEREEDKAERRQERSEAQGFRKEMAQLEAKLREDAAKEMRKMNVDVSARQRGIMRYMENFQAKQVEYKQDVAAFSALQDDMWNAGHYDSAEGRKLGAAVRQKIEDIEAFGDEFFDPRHLNKAIEIHNENLRRIARGQDPQDIRTFNVDHLLVPLEEGTMDGKPIPTTKGMDPDEVFKMKLMGGYPMDGVIGNSKPNFGMPKGSTPSYITVMTVLGDMNTSAKLSLATDKSMKRELTRGYANIVVESRDRLQSSLDQYTSLNKMFNALAPVAVDAALRSFVDNPDPGKFSDPGRALFASSMSEIFGGGSIGEKMALNALEIFDGKREPKSAEELAVVMAYESASFNLKAHLFSELQSAGEEGRGSVATQLVNQLIETVGEEKALNLLGVPQGTTAIVGAQAAMQSVLGNAHGFVNRAHGGFRGVSVLEQYKEQLKSTIRSGDSLAFIVREEQANEQGRLRRLISQEAAREGVERGVQQLTPGEAGEALSELDTSGLEDVSGLVDGVIKVYADMDPDRLFQITNLWSGGELPDVPDLATHLKNSQRIRAQNRGSEAAWKRAGANWDRQQRAKKVQAQQPKVSESFQKGGAPQVALEHLPTLLGLGASSLSRGFESLRVGTATALGGREEGVKTLKQIRSEQEGFAKFLAPSLAKEAAPARPAEPSGPGELGRQGTGLTPEETQGVLNPEIGEQQGAQRR